MLNLAEYRGKPKRLADYLPWAMLIAPHIVLCKDGSFMAVARYRGVDIESATTTERIGLVARVNDLLKRFGSGWALYLEAARIPCAEYPHSTFPDAASFLVDQERRACFEQTDSYFETVSYLTLQYLPPAEVARRGETWLFDGPKDGNTSRYRRLLARFDADVARLVDLLALLLPEIHVLGDSDLLTYLYSTISTKRQNVCVPDHGSYLDAWLSDTPLTGGLAPQLGDQHLRVLTLTGFASHTTPAMLDDLNRLGFAYRWMTRVLPLDKPQAEKAIASYRRQWFAKRKSIGALIKETMFNEAAALTDSDALNKSADADSALQELGSDLVGYGYMTMSFVVMDRESTVADEKRSAIERVLAHHGLVAIAESLNAVETWLGSLPGNPYANVWQPLVSTLNLAHLMPLSSLWAGNASNTHLKAPCLLQAKAQGATPFRLNLHDGDVGHTLVVGPTGAGKSVLLATLALQFRRYKQAQVIIFDKGASCRTAVLGMGGRFVDLGAGGFAFQPLAHIDDPADKQFALEWLCSLVVHEQLAIDPAIKEQLWSALNALASAPRCQRTLTGLSLLLQSHTIRQALQPYTLEGAFGALFDADHENLPDASVQAFELESLLHQKSIVVPVLDYLFHRLEARFDGRPTLLLLDEAWMLLDNTAFAARIRTWLKTLRKKNVAVVFATQSLSDVLASSIAAAVIESCPTRIFLANDRAIEVQIAEIYRRFGLNDRQLDIIAHATPKRDYYLTSRAGARLFELELGPIALALCAAAWPAHQRQMDEICSKMDDPSEFMPRWLETNNLDWAAELARGFQDKTDSREDAKARRESNTKTHDQDNSIIDYERNAA